jgi:predicted RNA-binding Zn ribbon-like protein
MNKERSIATLPLDGGVLCFDFINTVHAWRGPNLFEYLGSYENWLQWCQKVGIVTPKRKKALQNHAQQHATEANRAFSHIIAARKVLYQLFSAVAAGEARLLDVSLLSQFNHLVTEALRQLAFRVNHNSLELGWQPSQSLLAPFYIVMKSAYDVLNTTDASRIKECPACGWIFLDHTKNNKRRWCSPQTCGSIEKSKKYYRKKKAARD